MKIRKQIDLRNLIFSKVSEEQVFRFYYPYKFELNKPCLSCFKQEKNPSMIIGNKSQSGSIIFKSFNSNNQGDCVNFVMQFFGIDYFEALNKIAEDFGLVEESGAKYERVISSIPVVKEAKPRPSPEIKVMIRKFNKEELRYWSDYYQDLEDLKSENIYVPKAIWFNKQKVNVLSTELTFCYYYPDIDKWKIYKPFATKSKKWFSNVPFTHIEHLDSIANCDLTIANKSKKDYLVLRKALGISCIVTTQAEDVSCWTESSISKLKENSKIQYCSADNDTKGVSYSWLMTERYGFRHINVPYNIPDLRKKGKFITDWADWARDYGLEVVTNHFKNKGII